MQLTFALLVLLGLISVAAGSPTKEKPHPLQEPQLSAKSKTAPILESSKKVYNDESIRRLAVNQAPIVEPVQPPVSAVKETQPALDVPVKVASSPAAQVDSSPLVKSESVAQSVAGHPALAQVIEPIAPEQAVVAKSAVPALLQPNAEDQIQAKKDVPTEQLAPIETPTPDPGLVLSEPIDSTTQLLIDLDEHMQKFLPVEDQHHLQPPKDGYIAGVDYSPSIPTGKSSAPLTSYSDIEEKAQSPVDDKASVVTGSPAPAAPSAPVTPAQPNGPSSAARQAGHQHQQQQQVITQLLDQLDSLQNRIQDTINQLVARRRYVMSALLRPMGTYVRRVRSNLERLQNRINQLQSAAASVGSGQNRPGFIDSAAIETIRRRIDDINKRISDIVNRIRYSLTPTSAPLNSNGRK